MKKVIITLAALIAMSMSPAVAQQRTSETSKPKTDQVITHGKKVKHNGKPTGRTYKGYPVYQGAKGGLYVIRVSKKTGNEYTQYVKPDQLDPK